MSETRTLVNEGNTLTFQSFDPDSVFCNQNTNILLLGKKFTGKSTLIKHILYTMHKHRFPRIVVFSSTESSNMFYGNFVPQQWIYHECDPNIVERIVNAQKQIVATVKKVEAMTGKPSGVDTRLILVFDDVVHNKSFLTKEVFRFLSYNSRHVNITFIIACQYLICIPLELRSNFDLVFVLRETTPVNRTKIYLNFFGCFEKKEIFFVILDALTKNFECLVLNTMVTTINPEDMVFFFKASLDLPPFFFRLTTQK